MNLIYNILPTYLLLDVCMSSINIDNPRGGNYLRYSDPALSDNNYQNYDSYSSQEIVMRNAPHRSRKSHRRTTADYSDSEFNYKCKCSCTQCQKQKPKPCCEEFCATECTPQNNILVVPYPVPFIVFNQSTRDFTTLQPTTRPPSTTTTTPRTTTTTTPEPTTTTTEIITRPTFSVTRSTAPYYDPRFFNKHDPPVYKRYRVVRENNMRRNNMAINMLRSPSFGRLPKYGIVPIPENLALNLMEQIKNDKKNNDQYRKRLALDKKLLDYRRAIA
ncbi:hypothetical protein PYW08_004630 [Mythimna loreyi]|uniref:Uncharacterized protein n=1 Tax=Mythimna loreyi TaxID=667449 RepID=A0ACC2QPZ7_9NEOP|nr:hypothetical protein PYW08_004630 [Mythimna loreyi]